MWTQEAHGRHVASACYAALSNGWGGGEVRHPVLVGGGTWGTPTIQTWLGVLPRIPLPSIQTWWGGGYSRYPLPSRPGWGVPRVPLPPSRPEMGYPLPRPEMGYPPLRPGMGYPRPSRPEMGSPLPRPEMGYPPSWPEMGYPPTQTWDGVPPHLDLEQGTSPPRKCGQTENITFSHPSDAGGKK